MTQKKFMNVRVIRRVSNLFQSNEFYANTPIMEACRTGKIPIGSIAIEFLEIIDKKTRIDKGKGDMLMVKDTLHYANTGGWGFEEFDVSSTSTRKVTQVKLMLRVIRVTQNELPMILSSASIGSENDQSISI